MLIDVRPLSDFSVGHIPGAFCLRLSSILLRRFTQGKLGLADIVVEEQREHFKTRAAHPLCKLVLYDESCASVEPYDPKSTLHAVLACVSKSFADVAILKGGYAAFHSGKGEHVAVGKVADGESLCLLLPPSTPLDLDSLGTDKTFVDRAPSRILPHLYVGSQAHAQSRDTLQGCGITHVINITATCPNRFEGELAYLSIPIKDTWNQCISDHFQPAFAFIDAAKLKGGVVLLHCVAGISRSPTFAIAYLMHSLRLSLEAAINMVKAQRSIISPNLDFMVELQRLDKQLRGVCGAPCATSSAHDGYLSRTCSQESSDSQGAASEGLGESAKSEGGGRLGVERIGGPESPLSPSSRAISLCASLNRDSFVALLDTRS